MRREVNPLPVYNDTRMPDFIILSTGLLNTWLNDRLAHPTLLDEHGLLENLQAAVLLFSTAAFLIRLPITTAKNAKLFFSGGALFCLTCALREMDVEELNVHPWLIFLGSGLGRDLFIGSLWIAFVAKLLPAREQVWHYSLAVLRTSAGGLLVLAGVLVVAGALFDKGLLSTANSLFWEETLELFGYALLCTAAHTISSGTSYIPGSKTAVGPGLSRT
jgi:hypothetical protein